MKRIDRLFCPSITADLLSMDLSYSQLLTAIQAVLLSHRMNSTPGLSATKESMIYDMISGRAALNIWGTEYCQAV